MTIQHIATRIAIYPKPGDEAHVRGYMGGSDDDIPVLDLDQYGFVHLQFNNRDDAVAFLDTLADEASSLAAKIRTRQQQDARLLAAVGATPTGGA